MMADGNLFVEDSPAKVNLALHITGQRDDGFHLLESLVVFTAFGDRIEAQFSQEDKVVFTGPFSEELEDCPPKDNLIIKARDALLEYAHRRGMATRPLLISCEKNLPVASGLGGGSADAAATLRLLNRVWKLGTSEQDLISIASDLGADVPMCLQSQPLLAKGIGDELTNLPEIPALAILLVNPLIQVSTPVVFKKLKDKSNPPIPASNVPANLDEFVQHLQSLRNDLQSPAIEVAPEISECLDVIAATSPLLHRMSGSGASCFGIYQNMMDAQHACDRLKVHHGNWFCAATSLRGK